MRKKFVCEYCGCIINYTGDADDYHRWESIVENIMERIAYFAEQFRVQYKTEEHYKILKDIIADLVNILAKAEVDYHENCCVQI